MIDCFVVFLAGEVRRGALWYFAGLSSGSMLVLGLI